MATLINIEPAKPATLVDDELILYVGDDSGALAKKGYIWFARGNGANPPVMLFPKTFYGDRVVSMDFKQTRDSLADDGMIVVAETVHMYENEGTSKGRSATHTFQLINRDMQVDVVDETQKIGATDEYCLVIKTN
jgi:hypothetical protein